MWKLIFLGFSCLIACSWALTQTATAREIYKFPDKNLARYVVEHLDVTTFPSSIRQRRENGKTTFKDYGFKPVEMSETEAVLKEPGWRFEIHVLEHTSDSITICLHDKAENGGTYNAQSSLLLKKAKNADRLIASSKKIRDKRCPEFAR